MSRRAQILVTVFFSATIAAPLVLFALGVRPEVLDNREVAEWPSPGPGDVLDAQTYGAVDDYLVDRLPFRDRAIRLDAEIDQALTVFDSYEPGVPGGRDGWLYLPETMAAVCTGGPPEAFIEEGEALAHEIEARGVPFLMVVAPDKATVYPEHLPLGVGQGDEGLPGCGQVWRDELRPASDEASWLTYLYDRLRDLADSQDELVYLRTDTHWSDLGALENVEEVVTSIAPGVWDEDAIVSRGPRSAVRDLTRMRGLDDEEVAEKYAVERAGVEVVVEQEGGSEGPTVTRATTDGAPLIGGTTVIIGDSFTLTSLGLFLPYFERLVYLPWDEFDVSELEALAGAQPTAVVLQMVQRNLASGDYAIPFGELRAFADA